MESARSGVIVARRTTPRREPTPFGEPEWLTAPTVKAVFSRSGTMRIALLVCAALGLATAFGCGSGERGRNKDLDRPAPVSAKR